jgi:class 3 adenylate cyclase/tetratricopeptide (TPR) repeat protein
LTAEGSGPKLDLVDCPGCGHGNRALAKFCDACGQLLEPGGPLGQPDPRSYTPAPLAEKMRRQRPSEGERRTVTVLFVDAVGSTPLAEKLGEEEMYSLMREALSRMTEAVHRYEGHVATFTGDGMMALFGAPIAHEDSARRAVAAALRMQRSLDEYAREVNQRHGVDCRFRVGLNTGPVVVGTVSDDLRMDFTAIGDTVNLAARMEQVADPGSVLVSEPTHRVVAGFFECDALGDLAVKGKVGPVRAYRVLREKPVRTRFEAAAERGLSPLVGRGHELALLQGQLDRARQGAGQVVFVSGEAGIGKSRLILELRRRVADVRWLEGHCVSYGGNSPYLPVVDLLKGAFGIEEGDDDAGIIRRVDEVVAGWEEHAQKRAPYLKYLLSVDPGDESVTTMDPQERRIEIFEALGALLLEESHRRPLVVVVEDLHWADQMSQEALGVLLAVVPSTPVLLVLTHRPGYERPSGDFTVLELDHLDDEESVALTRGVLGVEALPPEVQGLVTAKAEGNPFYIEEVSKALVETGVVARVNGSYELRRPIEDIHIPGTIQEVILSRIDRLEREAKQAIQLASVIGREFTARLLGRISDLKAQLSEVLNELKVLDLIYEKALFPELAYMFKHALTHDVAYATLLAERRRALHRLVGAAIEDLYGDRLAEHYETLAHHYYEGQDWEKALDYLEKAGDKATAAYANQDALRFYGRALEVCDVLGEQAVPASASLAGKRGFVNFIVGDMSGAIGDFDRMLAAAQRLGSRPLEATALGYRGIMEVLKPDLERAEATLRTALAIVEEGCEDVRPLVSLGLVWLMFTSNRLPEAEPFLITADQAAALPDPFLAGNWSFVLGFFQYWWGHSEKALRVLRAMSEAAAQLMSNRVWNWWVQGLALGTKGDYEAALSVLEDAVASSERVGDTIIRPRLLNTVGWIYGELEDHERAIGRNRLSVEMASVPGFHVRDAEMHARLNVGDNLVALGRPDEAEEQFRVVEAGARSTRPADLWLAWRYSQHLFHSYGELWLGRGDTARALAYADECLELALYNSSVRNVVKGRRLRGQVLLAQGRPDEAEHELAAALNAAIEFGNPPQLWKTHVAIGDLRRAQGRPEEARRSYGEALSIIEGVAESLTDERLRERFLRSKHVESIRRAAKARS